MGVYNFPLLDTWKLDFVIVSKQDLLDPLNIMAVGEIRVITAKYGMFSNEVISYATSFGEKLLQLQLCWPFIYVVLTNCHVFILIFITRSGNSNLNYKYTPLANLESDSGSPVMGWQQLIMLLSQNLETLGWIPLTLRHEDKEIKLVRLIETGRIFVGIYADVSWLLIILKLQNKRLSIS